ncbi:hypothetical protein [Dickeya lacustris]|uniref:Uncharacterized protein n=1 Tax=Dickeya lacustris TaxID=2259638 RepID=A0ABY8G800_9GAMM|nr:hypothetical protein [Dickeya lacustris]WFN56062.1 hypothetical protein O1Q98_01660 [Dickeya lacustris]
MNARFFAMSQSVDEYIGNSALFVYRLNQRMESGCWVSGKDITLLDDDIE